jgi:hypothetical protein
MEADRRRRPAGPLWHPCIYSAKAPDVEGCGAIGDNGEWAAGNERDEFPKGAHPDMIVVQSNNDRVRTLSGSFPTASKYTEG